MKSFVGNLHTFFIKKYQTQIFSWNFRGVESFWPLKTSSSLGSCALSTVFLNGHIDTSLSAFEIYNLIIRVPNSFRGHRLSGVRREKSGARDMRSTSYTPHTNMTGPPCNRIFRCNDMWFNLLFLFQISKRLIP